MATIGTYYSRAILVERLDFPASLAQETLRLNDRAKPDPTSRQLHFVGASLHPADPYQSGSASGRSALRRAPHGHGRLFVNSRYSPDCGREDLAQECWFPPF